MTAPLHILFVDDDLVFCDYFLTLARPYNLVLEVKHTFEEGKKAIEEGKSGAYIFDANLPDGSGYDLAGLVRHKYGEQVPITVISGIFRDSEHFNKLKESLNVNYVIDKPIAADEAHRLLMELSPKTIQEVQTLDPLEKLKQKYNKMIPAIISELDQLISTLKLKGDEESLKALRQNVHKIAGSAGSVGYPAVSDLCKQWERFLIKKLETLAQSPIDSDWKAELDDFFGRVKFNYQVAPEVEGEKQSVPGRPVEGLKRLPLYVVDSDRSLLGALEREQSNINYQVSTEWDPDKAMRLLSQESFNPRVLIVGESFRASPIHGMDLIDLVRKKANALPTTFGIILDKEDLKIRADSIQKGITYVLEKPISGQLFLNTVKGTLDYEGHPDLKVLIVDDDPFVCELISAALSEIGVRHKALGDGTKLFEVIKEYKPDMLLLDIYMPGYNGVELLKTLRSDVRFNRLMIVIITSSQDNQLLSEAYTGNVDDILHKPLDKKIIQTRVLSLAKKQAILNQYEKTDTVTGLPNQSAFNVFLHERLLNAEYARSGLFIAMFELDQFGLISSAETSENILTCISNLLLAREKQLGFESYIGRGRFAVISDFTDLHSFKAKLENFMETSLKEIHPPESFKGNFTFSCGLISLPLNYSSSSEVIRSAENALMEAKQLGKDMPVKIVSHLNEIPLHSQKRKVILIDQDEDLLQILRTSFEAKGIEVSSYQLGEKFLEDLFIKQNPLPPLLIIERLLPDMDGIDLLKRLHKRYPVQLPVIFLTSLSSDKDVMDGLKAGALDYITKPFNLHQMIQKSITALSR